VTNRSQRTDDDSTAIACGGRIVMLGLLVLGLLLRSVGLVAVTVQPSRSLRGGSARYGPLVATGVAGPGGTAVTARTVTIGPWC